MIGKIGALGMLSAAIGMAQATAPSAMGAATLSKVPAFEVVSIRQSTSRMASQDGVPPFGPTADGYHMTGVPLILPILTAFVPQAGDGMFSIDQIHGLPDWAMKEPYDMDARIANEDRAEWVVPATQKAMLPAMLQSALADRCKLMAHREMKDASVYLLVVGKGGVKFPETNPSDTPPNGIAMPGGAIMVRDSNNTLDLYGTSIGFFATMLSQMEPGQPVVVDKTGLTGKYNIIVKSIISHAGQQASSGDATDPEGSIFSAMEALGLKLEPGKASVENLVIDHIERPSSN